ncbi:protein arginine N-methyltransferase 5 [Onthophagus taurus]|uniref:protein arginine N-methyltransferase 5 n=1 Tax=Onthophagus taurus TaxID=166361 RepID=UPI0039BE3FC2
MSGDGDQEKFKRMSCGLELDCPASIQDALSKSTSDGYHFIVTCLIHPQYHRTIQKRVVTSKSISRTDRILTGNDWTRLIVGKLSTLQVDSEIKHVKERSEIILKQELGFASHLGLPAIMIQLHQKSNPNLAHILHNTFLNGANYQVWVTLPMVHPSKYTPLCEKNEIEDSWEWWNDLRRYCRYDKRLGLVLEMPNVGEVPSKIEMDRWVGEPIKAIIIPTYLFLTNGHNQPVLSKVHQEIIQRFLLIDVQYIIRGPLRSSSYKQYNSYIHFLGKKLYKESTVMEFVQGCEDYLQNPLQPLSEHLETMIYEVFERDQVKYVEYQKAIQRALEDIPKEITTPVIMVLGAGRGPLVQAVINASILTQRKIKVYAVEKNPFAINTLEDRVLNEWGNIVTLINEDMRTYQPPEQADILVSELLGSFGDNELSPECLDGAQRFLKKPGGISIPQSYTSYLAPFQSTKIFNEIRSNKPDDKTIETIYETPYVVHMVNYYQIADSKALFKFEHPNWDENKSNERFKTIKFLCPQNCLLTGFLGFFETVLYKDVMLSINPQTYSSNMVSWFPIIFPLQHPINVAENDIIEVSMWRSESNEKVWYEWCLESPVKGHISNPNGRSYFIKKH